MYQRVRFLVYCVCQTQSLPPGWSRLQLAFLVVPSLFPEASPNSTDILFILDLTKNTSATSSVGTSTVSSIRTSPSAPTLRTSIALLLKLNDCSEACCINASGFLLLQVRRSTRLEDSRGHDLIFVTTSVETSLCAGQDSYIDLLYRREAASAFP
jgi:hypothetical protein